MEYDVFISYRRDGGEHLAKMLRDSLTERGYRVFFDVESLRSGEFNKALYNVIENCKDVVLICSPHALDRCVNDGDWVYQEIEYAMRNKKNLIPIMARGFAFPEVLPEAIDNIRWMNGLEANMEFYDAFLDRLDVFLKAEPVEKKKKKKKRRILVAAISLVLLAGGITVGIQLAAGKNAKPVYPKTDAEKSAVSELVYYVEWNTGRVDYGIKYAEEIVMLYSDYLNGEDHSEEKLYTTLQSAVAYINKIGECRDEIKNADEEMIASLQEGPVNTADVKAMSDASVMVLQGLIDDFSNFGLAMLNDGQRVEEQKKWISIYDELVDMDAKSYFYSMNEILAVVSEDSLTSFRTDFLPLLYMSGFYSWTADEEQANAYGDEAYKRYEELVEELEVYSFATQ